MDLFVVGTAASTAGAGAGAPFDGGGWREKTAAPERNCRSARPHNPGGAVVLRAQERKQGAFLSPSHNLAT
uniref:Putative secreted protein n=1 Tax=Anopheles triannulatus TaxID=58253 RepID=A0A2M4B3F4_9DIPT